MKKNGLKQEVSVNQEFSSKMFKNIYKQSINVFTSSHSFLFKHDFQLFMNSEMSRFWNIKITSPPKRIKVNKDFLWKKKIIINSFKIRFKKLVCYKNSITFSALNWIIINFFLIFVMFWGVFEVWKKNYLYSQNKIPRGIKPESASSNEMSWIYFFKSIKKMPKKKITQTKDDTFYLCAFAFIFFFKKRQNTSFVKFKTLPLKKGEITFVGMLESFLKSLWLGWSWIWLALIKK